MLAPLTTQGQNRHNTTKGQQMETIGITFWLLAIGVIYLATQLGKGKK
tara:strand:+ start:747 stop:890 length:144 start_codon:yes stop_codon:yes gene_type:complete